TAQSDGTRVCHGTFSSSGGSDERLKSFDGQPLAVYVTLPAASDNPYPLIIQSHGWGEPPTGPTDTQYFGPTADAWAQAGYAVLQLAPGRYVIGSVAVDRLRHRQPRSAASR